LPEVRRLDLAEVILTLKASGVCDVRGFRWLEPPDPKSLDRAETLLTDLGATGLGANSAITETGRRMLAFPVHPRYARMLLAAQDYGCVRAVALVAALTQGRSILRRVEDKQMRDGRDDLLGDERTSDFFVLMRAFQFAQERNFNPSACQPLGIHAGAAREAAALAAQFLQIAKDEGLDIESRKRRVKLSPAVCSPAFLITWRCASTAVRYAARWSTSDAECSPAKVSCTKRICSSQAEVREIGVRDGVETLLTLATAIKEEWLRELFPEAFRDAVEVSFDKLQKRVVARKSTCFHDLVLRAKESDDVPKDQAAALLADVVLSGEHPARELDPRCGAVDRPTELPR
jgi:ATP-dependent helicase HrpB